MTLRRGAPGGVLALALALCQCSVSPELIAYSIAPEGGSAQDSSSSLQTVEASLIDSAIVFPDGTPDGRMGEPSRFSDFPSAPSIDPGLPSEVLDLFRGADVAGDGPCLSEPSLDALYPPNFTPPLFEWSSPAEEDLFELTLRIDNQDAPYVLYTSTHRHTLPPTVWSAIAEHSKGHDVQVSVRGGRLTSGQPTAGPTLGSTGQFRIAPHAALGRITYFATSDGTSIKTMNVGESTAKTVVSPTKNGNGAKCVACHSTTPDDSAVFFARSAQLDGPSWIESLPLGSVAAVATTSNAAIALSRTDQTNPFFSPAHWSASERLVFTSLHVAAGNWEIAWTDATSVDGATGIFARTGDSSHAANPTISHDGNTLVYSSAMQVSHGHPSSGAARLRAIPFAERQGGVSVNLAVNEDKSALGEYSPAFSPTDHFIAYTRAPLGHLYDEPNSEIYLVPREGGLPYRLPANDPPACSSHRSPGVSNGEASFSPQVVQDGSTAYSWIIFSSGRRGGGAQLYVAGMETFVDNGLEVIRKVYAPVYVTSQAENESNHGARWSFVEQSPPVPMVP